ncbi:MAG: glycoside hydrolase family 5 protein [bacterium]
MKKVSSVIIGVFLVLFGLILVKTNLRAAWYDFLFTSKDALTVSGNKILFNKEEVWLTGVAMGDPHSRVEIDRRTIADYESIKKDWRANTVRLSIHPGVYKRDLDDMKKILEEEVAAAREQGLYVIIDWHVIGMPNGWFKPSAYGEDHYYSYDSNFNTAREFWEMIAVKYRGDRGVMFELWNEPADPKTNEWKNLKPYMDQLYGIIRSQGADNIIIVPGVWWTYDLRGIKNNPLKGENIAYGWHNYEANSRYLTWSQALEDLNEKYPVLVTEWGYETDPASDYNVKTEYPENFKQFIIDKGLHFTAWCWHSKWKPRMFKSDWEILSDYGQFIKSFLLEIDIKKQFTGDGSQIKISDQLDNFIKNGADINTKKLGEGERTAVVYSFQRAFNRMPQTQTDLSDVIKAANGLTPEQKSLEIEKLAMNEFYKIYLRPAGLVNGYDYMAVMIMAYGLRQKAVNRNLNSEAQGIKIFKSIYHKLPNTTEEWNIMQAITYSGAKR